MFSRFRVLGRLLLLLAAAAACFVVACVYRLSGDGHFSRVHLQLQSVEGRAATGAAEAGRQLEVYVRFAGTDGWPLEPVAGKSGVWRHAGPSRPVRSVLIASRDPLPLSAEQVQIHCGEYWSWPDQSYSGAELTLGQPEAGILNGFVRNGLPHVVEVTLKNPPDSLLSRSRGMLNWQGDLSLLFLALLQTLIMTIAGLQVLRRAFRVVESPDVLSWESGLALFSVSSAAHALLILLLGVQLFFYFGVAAGQRSAWQLAAGLICVLAVIAAGTWLIRTVVNRSGPLLLSVGGILLVLLMTAGVWVFREPLECRPDEAALLCLELGELLAADGWDGLARVSRPVSMELVRQAVVFSLPAVKVLGTGPAAVQAAGLFLQACCALLFFWLAVRIVGLRGAAAGLALLVLVEPEFRFLGAAGSPRIAECFCVLLAWCGFEYGRIWLRRVSVTGQEFPRLVWLLACLLFGVALALVELSSSRGIFWVAALFLAVWLLRALPKGRHADGWNVMAVPSAAVPLGLVLAIGLSWLIVKGVDQQISNYLPQSLQVVGDADAELTAVESGTEGAGRSVSIWRDMYFPLVPDAERKEFVSRKLIHEKFGAGSSLFGTMLRKAVVYARSDYALDADPNRPVLPYPVVRAVLRYGLSCWIVILVLMRLWNSLGEGVSRAEVYPVCSILCVLTTLLLVSEARPEDSLIWLMPACWSAGAVLGRRSPAEAAKTVSIVGLPRHILPGAALLSAVILLHTGLGMLADRSGRTFASIAPVKSEAAAQKLAAVSDVTRVSFTVRFPDVRRGLKAGSRVSEEVRVLCDRSELPALRFFLSGGQRQSKITRMTWENVPVKYSVYINDRLWKSGPISELERPQYCQVDARFWNRTAASVGNFVYVRLMLTCTADTSLSSLPVRPAVSLEYPWAAQAVAQKP
ncbi:MAG: hypothetical protein RLZZ436_3052 [Planctomycetota bacterium]